MSKTRNSQNHKHYNGTERKRHRTQICESKNTDMLLFQVNGNSTKYLDQIIFEPGPNSYDPLNKQNNKNHHSRRKKQEKKLP